MKHAKNFILKDQFGNEFELFKNLDKSVLLIFYPKDNSPVCSRQLSHYQANIQKFLEAGIKLVGVNVESIESHKSFCDLKGLKFPVLSDTEKTVSKRYKALNILSTNMRKLVLITPQKEVVFEHASFMLNYPKTKDIFKWLSLYKII
jgi:peroxiredoxin Q/BCP